MSEHPRLAHTTVELLRLVRELREEGESLRIAHRATKELLRAALDQLHAMHKDLERARATTAHMRDQIRQSLKTNAFERQRDDDAADWKAAA